MNRIFFAMVSCVGMLGFTGSICGDLVVTAVEQGDDVVFSGAGSIDLSGLGAPAFLARPGRVKADEYFLVGPGGNFNFDTYQVSPIGPLQIGPGTVETNASSGTGDGFGLDFAFGTLAVPENYLSSDALQGTARFENQTFQSLGLATGRYEWTFGNNTIRLNVVPEPSGALVIAMTCGLLAARRRRIHGG